ncbi:MAG: hypothetical protein PV344_03300 [Anaplasma sp.]|nr:hypothetical protein [Anaplasma sp.]
MWSESQVWFNRATFPSIDTDTRYCKRLNFRGLKFSRIGPKLKI